MPIEHLKLRLPDYAKDIKLNISSVLTETGAPGLNQKQIYGVALASAYITNNLSVIEAIEALCQAVFEPVEIDAIKSATIIMGMNNIYYRFIHLSSDSEYANLPAKLRMNVIGNPGIDKVDFELYCLAISALNGCGMCLDAHALTLTQAGLPKVAIQSAIRIASVINGLAVAERLSS